MKLTRRDALAALAAAGVTGVAAAVFEPPTAGDDRGGHDTGLGDHERATLVAVARTVYPSAVANVEAFVAAYLRGRTADDPDYPTGAAAAVRRLDRAGEEWHGGRFRDLDPGPREQLLREVGADTAEPDPQGSPAERVRYYLVNELLFALYASPTGGELVGIENPQGHPGGLESYRRGPDG